MAARRVTPNGTAIEIRRFLKDGGSPDHALGVQWFFKEEIKSHGWYTSALRKSVVKFRRISPATEEWILSSK
jgi:hypothetical protein